MAFDTMRRYLTQDEETATVDATTPEEADATTPEEADATLAGVSIPEWRDLGQPSKGPMAALDRAANAARVANTGPLMVDTDIETGPLAALRRATAYSGMSEPEADKTAFAYTKQGMSLPAELQARIRQLADKPSSIQPVPSVRVPVQQAADTPSEATAQMTKPEVLKTEVPAPGAGGDDDDALRRARLAQIGARAFASFGELGAGRKVDTGAAEALGERVKMLEALKTKRAEREESLALERANYGATNRATLASFMAQYKDRPEVVDALKAAEAGADTTKPSDFLKVVTGALTTPSKVAGAEAGAELAKARKPLVGAQAAVMGAKAADIPLSAKSRDELRRSQIDLNKARIEHMGAKKEAASAPASTTGPLADPKLEQRRQDSFSKITRGAQKLYTDPLVAVASLEKAAGSLTKGQKPDWWTVQNIAQINAGVYAGLPPEAVQFAKTYFPVVNQLRHALYGSALSAGEQKAFADQIELGIRQGPKALAASIQALADASKKATRLQLGYDLDRNPDLAAKWLQSSGFRDAVAGTSLADTFPEPTSSTSGRSPKPAGMVRVLHRASGQTATVSREKADEMLKAPGFEEVP